MLRDAAGDVLRVSLGEGDVDCRPYYEADPEDWIVKALVAAEDGTFWKHCGVRPLSVLRAAFQNVTCRRRISGASTLTMQAVRLMKPHPKSLWWKYKEAVMALKMERAKDKRWILSQYLNRAPFGSNFVGVEAAANGWFGKGAKQLGVAEAAMLAGMVQAPSRFRPDRGFERALKRRDYVLGRMRELGMLDDAQLAGARAIRPVVCRAPRPFKHPYYCDWAMRTLGKDRSAQRRSGDFKTALDANVQRVLEEAVNRAADAGGYSAAGVVMRVDTGGVLALACSGGYFSPDGGQVNTALAPRPAGSTLKPFLAALAMDRGLATPETRLADVPMAAHGYRPANFDARHRGSVSLQDALVLSLNVPFVRLLKEVGVPAFADALRAFGFGHVSSAADAGLGMAIGNVEVTLMELVAAYRTLARGGGDACSRGAAHLTSEMLSGDERSGEALGHVADVPLPRFAWKTGTSAAYRDAWTVLWNPEYVVGVWCGHKRGGFGDVTLVGAKAAAPVAWGVARTLYPRNGGPWFVEPGEVTRRKTCALTGAPAGPDCPSAETGRALAGRSSNKPCDVHVRGLDGRVVVREDAQLAAFSGRAAAAGKLSISKPEDGAKFRRVAGMPQQKVVCRAVGNPQGARLWWVLDDVPAGETTGSDPFALDMTPGEHVVVCVNAEGVSAASSFSVTED